MKLSQFSFSPKKMSKPQIYPPIDTPQYDKLQRFPDASGPSKCQAWLWNAISCLPSDSQCHEFYADVFFLLTERCFHDFLHFWIGQALPITVSQDSNSLSSVQFFIVQYAEAGNLFLQQYPVAQRWRLFRYSLLHSRAPKGGLISYDLGVTRPVANPVYLCIWKYTLLPAPTVPLYLGVNLHPAKLPSCA